MMKTIFLTTIMVLGLVACNKAEMDGVVQPKKRSEKSPAYQVWHDGSTGSGLVGCWNTGGTCLPTAIIYGSANLTGFNDVLDALDTQDNSVIASAFAANNALLDAYFAPVNVDNVIAQNGHAEVTRTTKYDYIRVYDSNGVLREVLPVDVQ